MSGAVDASGPALDLRGASAAARAVVPLDIRGLLELNAYWLAINVLWGALGISLLPVLAVSLVCGGDPTCSHPIAIVGGFAPGKGVAVALVVNLGLLVSILVQPTAAALSDYTTGRLGRRKPYILVGTLLDMAFLVGFALAGSWLGILAWYLLLQFSSNLAQGPFQGFLPDVVGARQVGLASGLMGLAIMVGVGLGPMLVAVANGLGDPRYVVVPIMAIEFVTMLVTVSRVPDGPPGLPRAGRSWARVAIGAWRRDVLAERSYMWLLGSRFFFLMTGSTLTAVAFFYMQDVFRLDTGTALAYAFAAGALVVVCGALATIPSGRLSERHGRKRVIRASAVIGGLGMALLAVAPGRDLALAFVAPIGAGAGAFLAVDWALMTDIIPRAESGRYMSLSNVVTCGAGAVASAIALLIVDLGNATLGFGAGPRIALGLACSYYLVGSLLLGRVAEGRREGEIPLGQTVSVTTA